MDKVKIITLIVIATILLAIAMNIPTWVADKAKTIKAEAQTVGITATVPEQEPQEDLGGMSLEQLSICLVEKEAQLKQGFLQCTDTEYDCMVGIVLDVCHI